MASPVRDAASFILVLKKTTKGFATAFACGVVFSEKLSSPCLQNSDEMNISVKYGYGFNSFVRLCIHLSNLKPASYGNFPPIPSGILWRLITSALNLKRFFAPSGAGRARLRNDRVFWFLALPNLLAPIFKYAGRKFGFGLKNFAPHFWQCSQWRSMFELVVAFNPEKNPIISHHFGARDPGTNYTRCQHYSFFCSIVHTPSRGSLLAANAIMGGGGKKKTQAPREGTRCDAKTIQNRKSPQMNSKKQVSWKHLEDEIFLHPSQKTQTLQPRRPLMASLNLQKPLRTKINFCKNCGDFTGKFYEKI